MTDTRSVAIRYNIEKTIQHMNTTPVHSCYRLGRFASPCTGPSTTMGVVIASNDPHSNLMRYLCVGRERPSTDGPAKAMPSRHSAVWLAGKAKLAGIKPPTQSSPVSKSISEAVTRSADGKG